MANIQIETVTPGTLVTLTPQAADPATNAAAAQVYAKTDKGLYHKDTAGLVTSLLAASQSFANAVAGTTTTYPYGSFNGSGPLLLSSGASQNVYKGFIARNAGSVIGATWMGAAGAAVSGSIQVYKNGSLFFTALTGCNFPGNSAQGGPVVATFPAGTYPFVQGDYFDVYYTGSGTGLYMGVGITFTEGNAYANPLSTVLAANTTVAATDNQRTWVASSATAYVLTLPATQATQDMYVRVICSGGGGVTVQAASGQTIYLGVNPSAVAGSIVTSATGSTLTLMNPAGTNIWVAASLTGNWSVNT